MTKRYILRQGFNVTKNNALYKVTNVTKCDILRIGPNAIFYIMFRESHCFGFVEARHFKSSFGNKIRNRNCFNEIMIAFLGWAERIPRSKSFAHKSTFYSIL